MSKTKEEARECLLQGLPHFRYSANEAKKVGEMKLAIVAYDNKGGGRIVSSFAADEFFDDLALVLDAPAQNADDDMEAKAVELMQKFDL